MTPRALSPLLICAVYMTGLSVSLRTGQEFITAFLQNSNSSKPNAKFKLVITAYNELTSATVTLDSNNVSWSLNLFNGESQTVTLPNDIEMIGTGFFNSIILITSNHDISVTAVSSKPKSSARILVLPVDQLEKEYYIVTPSKEPVQNLKEFAVINYDMPNRVRIFVKNWVMYNGVNYTSNQPITVDLQPFQIFQLQSTRDLSGTRVSSENRVAVLSGNTCSWKNSRCGHVYEQLFPVSSWGKRYYVSPLPFLYQEVTAYVTASQYTKVRYRSNINNGTVVISEGDVLSFPVHHKAPLAISANVSIQVLFYCSGGSTEIALIDPFLVELPDISNFCTKYQVHGLQGFNNAVHITAQTKSISGIVFNKISLKDIQWRKIAGTPYSWTLYRYGRQAKSNIISHPTSKFLVLSVGISIQNSYGLSGVCLMSKESCEKKQCREKETCQIIHNKAACIPNTDSICQIWGDPHYQTFDGLNYDLQGACTYTVATTCMTRRGGGDPTLPEFAIEAKNNIHGFHKSSYIEMVFVYIYDYNITLVQSEYGFVRVNNVRWALPVLLDDGSINITTTGFHALLVTSFIRIRYDWNMFLFIKIPSSFYKNVCGLCGNYNGNKTDDMEKPDGTQVSDLVEFINSWEVKDEYSACCEDCCGVYAPALLGSGEPYKDPRSCGIISEDYGPFHLCHTFINPETFMNNCVYDMVQNGGYKRVLCEAVSVYLLVCQIQGIHVEEWRKKVGCEIECPNHSLYNPCGNPCPETCAGSQASCLLQMPCLETCECNHGFVFHEDRCILKTNCSHFCNGRYYPPSETFWGDNSCTQRCECDPASQEVKCWNYSCKAGQACADKDGIIDCYPLSYSQCSTFGDPHYITFDNVQYDFHGTCRYLLSGLCDKSRGLKDFSVEIFIRSRSIRHVSYTKSVVVNVDNTQIFLNRDNAHRAKVNGVLVNLPFRLHVDQVQIFVHGWDAVILTKFGLKVTFDWNSRITVTLPQSYAGAVCGLCGNYNGDTQDDMTMKNGEMSKTVSGFGNSWRNMNNSEGCREQESVSCPLFTTLESMQRKKLFGCGIILNRNGPFRDCHRLVNPEFYFRDCLSDFCFYFARQDVYCKVIEAYSVACQEANGTVYKWREDNFCKAWCPENSYYTLCSAGCDKTCSQIRSPCRCDVGCREGCVCKDGFLLDGDRCVPVSQCGCVHRGIYYKTNEIFYPTSQCDKKCMCHPGGLVKCSPSACIAREACNIHNGVRKCHPTELTMCSVLGLSHFHTFDGFIYDFQGDCTYVVTKTCSQENTLSANFSVYVSASAPKTVTVFVEDTKIVITERKPGAIQVDDVPFNLPIHLRDKDIWVYQNGFRVVLSARFGLEVTYDLNSQVIVNISNDFHGKVCGLCGNYNADPTDDFQLPDGSHQTNVTVFGDAWKDCTLGTCPNKCLSNDCSRCGQKKLYEQTNFCGMLLVKGGVFSACHDHVNPKEYFDNCVTEVCRVKGDQKVLCNSFQNYVTICKSVGVTGIQWRSPIYCNVVCPDHSRYAVCANTCSSTCARIAAPIACSRICSEGCQCDDGYYLDRDKCVPLEKCGCFIQGRYYLLNENFLGSHCRQICKCCPGNVITCKAYSCAEGTTCKKRSDMIFTCEK